MRQKITYFINMIQIINLLDPVERLERQTLLVSAE